MELNKIHVTLYREKNIEGAVIPMYIYVDGNLVAQLQNGGYSACDIDSGVHEICVKMWGRKRKSKINFLSEDKNVSIKFGLKYGFVTKKADILSIERKSDSKKIDNNYQNDNDDIIVCVRKIDESIFENIKLIDKEQTAMFDSSQIFERNLGSISIKAFNKDKLNIYIEMLNYIVNNINKISDNLKDVFISESSYYEKSDRSMLCISDISIVEKKVFIDENSQEYNVHYSFGDDKLINLINKSNDDDYIIKIEMGIADDYDNYSFFYMNYTTKEEIYFFRNF